MVLLVLLVAGLFVVRLFSLQVLDDTYKDSADSNAFMRKTIYPSRGLIYDRYGKLMVSNQPIYDVMLVMREMTQFDTLAFCQVMGITQVEFEERISNIKNRRTVAWHYLILFQIVSQQICKFLHARFVRRTFYKQ